MPDDIHTDHPPASSTVTGTPAQPVPAQPAPPPAKRRGPHPVSPESEVRGGPDAPDDDALDEGPRRD